MAVGYTTLYGDMAGGFAVIKDVPKTLVYRRRAPRERARRARGDPRDDRRRARRRPSCARTRPTRTRLPPYEVLDADPRGATSSRTTGVERRSSPQGFDRETVRRRDRAWWTATSTSAARRRSGIKITPRAFGRDWRLPIVNRFPRGPACAGRPHRRPVQCPVDIAGLRIPGSRWRSAMAQLCLKQELGGSR